MSRRGLLPAVFLTIFLGACGPAISGPDRTPTDPWGGNTGPTNVGTSGGSGTGGGSKGGTPSTPGTAPATRYRLGTSWQNGCIALGSSVPITATLQHQLPDSTWVSDSTGGITWTVGSPAVVTVNGAPVATGGSVTVRAVLIGVTTLTASAGAATGNLSFLVDVGTATPPAVGQSLNCVGLRSPFGPRAARQ